MSKRLWRWDSKWLRILNECVLDGYPLTAYRYYASTVAKGNLIVADAIGV
ncbi:hypothetical protein [Pseudomonas amygdali]|nr:hypothetical protein [Pseudomonas amygdali]